MKKVNKLKTLLQIQIDMILEYLLFCVTYYIALST